MKKNIFFKLFLFLSTISCSSIQFKELELYPTQKLRGNIESIIAVNTHYSDTKTNYKDSIIVFFDRNNNKIKQTEHSSRFSGETYYIYDKHKHKRLTETQSKDSNGKIYSKSLYTYDKNQNLIQYDQLENDKIIFSKIFELDNKGNKRKIIYKNPNKTRIDFLINDYKNYTVTMYDEKDYVDKKDYIKYYYNKKGEIIFSEWKNKNSISYTKSFYDSHGGLTKRLILDHQKKPKDSSIYKLQYDLQNNIVMKEHFWNNKLLQKSIYIIQYR